MPPIYLDNNATTPTAPEVLEAMLPFFTEHYHNPSGPYPAGERAADAVRAARTAVARLAGSSAARIVFTTGGSEGISTAFRSALRTTGRPRVLISAVEHSAVSRNAEAHADVTLVPVDAEGRLDRAALFDALDDSVALVSLMLVNNGG